MLNLDPEFDRHTSLEDMERRKDAIWAQEFGKAIARGETPEQAWESADLEAQTFESEWWGE